MTRIEHIYALSVKELLTVGLLRFKVDFVVDNAPIFFAFAIEYLAVGDTDQVLRSCCHVP